MGRPAHPGGNFGGKTSNLGAAPHDWGFAKKIRVRFKLALMVYLHPDQVCG
jgi:hypothetical protein